MCVASLSIAHGGGLLDADGNGHCARSWKSQTLHSHASPAPQVKYVPAKFALSKGAGDIPVAALVKQGRVLLEVAPPLGGATKGA